MATLYPRVIKIPIYGANEVTHDSFTQIKGSFKKRMKGIDTLLRAGIHRHLNCGVIRLNINEVKNIWELAHNLNLPIRYAYHTTSSLNPNTNTKELLYMESEILRSYFMDPRFSPLRPEIPNNNFSNSDRICDAGFRNICIGADGSIYVCDSLRVILGNTYFKNLQDIWHNSDFLQKWRCLSIKNFTKCAGCQKQSICKPCPGDYHLDSGSLQGIDDQTCFWGELCADISKNHTIFEDVTIYSRETHNFTEKACGRFLPRVNIFD